MYRRLVFFRCFACETDRSKRTQIEAASGHKTCCHPSVAGGISSSADLIGDLYAWWCRVSAAHQDRQPRWLRRYTEQDCETGHFTISSPWPVDHYQNYMEQGESGTARLWTFYYLFSVACRPLPYMERGQSGTARMWTVAVSFPATWWLLPYMERGEAGVTWQQDFVSSGVAKIRSCTGEAGRQTCLGMDVDIT